MYIEKIKSPADLKKLDLKELQVVADETRQAVLNRVSKHGGHVGAEPRIRGGYRGASLRF